MCHVVFGWFFLKFLVFVSGCLLAQLVRLSLFCFCNFLQIDVLTTTDAARSLYLPKCFKIAHEAISQSHSSWTQPYSVTYNFINGERLVHFALGVAVLWVKLETEMWQ